MKIAHLLPLAIALMATPASTAFAQAKLAKVKVKVAMVDVERCVGETEDGLRAKAAMAKARLNEDSRLFAMEESLKVQEARLQEMLAPYQQSGTPPTGAAQEEIQKRAMQYQKDMQDFQVMQKSAQSKLAQLEDQLFLPIEKKIKVIFERIAVAKGFDLLVDRKSMPVTLKPDLDLTEQVIDEYNKPAAAPAAK